MDTQQRPWSQTPRAALHCFFVFALRIMVVLLARDRGAPGIRGPPDSGAGYRLATHFFPLPLPRFLRCFPTGQRLCLDIRHLRKRKKRVTVSWPSPPAGWPAWA